MLNYNDSLQKQDILIVDDDATIRLLMKEALADDAYNVTDASNGLDALDMIKANPPDMVLLDVTMPGMNGFDVCTEIRKLYGDTNISIVMVTALEDAESIERSYHVGATDFIIKPINWDTFPYRIRYLMKARNAIIEIQEHKSQLEHMEHISRIITQNKNKDLIMQETMVAILDIFSANRIILLKSDETTDNLPTAYCEMTSDFIDGINNSSTSVIDNIDSDVIAQACNTEYPVVFHYDDSDLPPPSNPTLKQQIISSLHLSPDQTWYLVTQRNKLRKKWSISDQEIFYKISLRLTDMLSRHLLTEELGRSEAMLKQAQKISHIGSWHWSAETKRQKWSDEVYQIYGHSPDTYSPDFAEYYEVAFEEDRERLRLLKEMKNKIIISYQIDHRIRTSDNSIRWVNEQCIGVYDGTGALHEINGTVQDITDARIKNEQEVHNNKMEAIGQLTSGVAHDFGNLMTVARGNLELLEESIAKKKTIDPDDIELLSDARSAVNDSVELTRQLLYFSRKKSIDPTCVNIKKTLTRFKNLFIKTLGDNITLSININKNLPDILVDPNQFQSSLLNIVINARNAMPDGGKIEIDVKEIFTEARQEEIANTENHLGEKCVCICVSDTGKGMNEDVLARAIEPFYTTSTSQGTGLGLSMVYGFMKQSGGELIIRSQIEKGTSIYLRFPIGEGTATLQDKKAPANTLNKVHATILVVEDRPAVRQFAIRCLTQPGITLLQAEDAAAARKLLASNPIDLLFTDIEMPGDMDGHKLSQWANKHYPELKILLTTAMDKNDNKQTAETVNFKLLPKPYSKSELLIEIENLLKFRTD